ncbi:unnamed protein product [Heterobilharzia americana]|nr:unnamed protein product [Heterobilharzia americana]
MLPSNNLNNLCCRICNISMKTWNTERRKLHKNSCCETAIMYCHRCPACNKEIESRACRSHLKRCASKLNMDLFSLMSLSCQDHRFIRLDNEDVHTACALSLSMDDEVKRRKSEAILAEKIAPTDLGPPSHLLLSSEQRENIFAQKLESILLEVKRIDKLEKECIKKNSFNHTKLQSSLWSLASTEFNSQDNIRQIYYVDDLIPPLSPTIGSLSSDIISMSQIPGRFSLHAKLECESNNVNNGCDDLNHHFNDIKKDCTEMLPNASNKSYENMHHTMKSSISSVIPSNFSSLMNDVGRNPFLSMVGNSLCSDLCLILDDGDLIPAHKFVFAAWSLNVSYLESDILQIHNVTKDELISLLEILYNGDKSNITEEYLGKSSVAMQTLINDWGLTSSNRRVDIIKTDDSCLSHPPRKSLVRNVEETSCAPPVISVQSSSLSSPLSSIWPVTTQTNSTYIENSTYFPLTTNNLNQHNINSSILNKSDENTIFGLMDSSSKLPIPSIEESKQREDVQITVASYSSSLLLPSITQFSRDLFISSDDEINDNDDFNTNSNCDLNIDIINHHNYQEIIQSANSNNNDTNDISMTVIDLTQPETTVKDSPILIVSSPSCDETLKTEESPLLNVDSFTSPCTTSKHLCNSWLEDAATVSPLMKRLLLSNNDESISNSSPYVTAAASINTHSILTDSLLGCFNANPFDDGSIEVDPSKKQNQVSDYLINNTNIEYRKESSTSDQSFTPDKQLQTPVHESLNTTPIPITPLPKYEEMMTPELKRALSRYGVKPLPRKRAVLLLKEIYDQLHQYEEFGDKCDESIPNNKTEVFKDNSFEPQINPTNKENKRVKSNKSKVEIKPSVTTSTQVQYPHNHEAAIFELPVLDSPDVEECSKKISEKDKNSIQQSVLNYLKNDTNLYMNILTYTVISIIK